MRELTPNSRSHSNGRVVMETPIRGFAALNRNKSTTAMHSTDTNYQIKRTADNFFKLG
jgi:hypothetical protein